MTPVAAMSTCSAASASAGRCRPLSARLITLAALLLLGGGCHLARPAPMHPESPAGKWHLVAAGETLEEIARRAGVPVEDLAEINGLAPGERALPGRMIFVLEPSA